ncbi:MAG TPA: hypothetical protein VL981_10800 [Candidatus Methylacidiphilales bacterium]|nr:hypothetical protein [Candidatus Methylacidiphilales bacterium]
MNRQKKQISVPGASGFSLVEVCIALAVVAFSFITLIGLLGAGVSTDQKAAQQTTATNILSSIVADLRSTPAYAYASTYTSSNGSGGSPATPHYKITLPAAPTTAGPSTTVTSTSPLSTPLETAYLYFDANQNFLSPATTSNNPSSGAIYTAVVYLSPIVAVGPTLTTPDSSNSGSNQTPSYQLIQSTIMARVVVSWPSQAAIPAGSVETVTEFRLH